MSSVYTIKLENLSMKYDEKTYIHAEDCWKDMRTKWKNETYKIYYPPFFNVGKL